MSPKPRNHESKNRGFTLIEIISVLVILGILAAVAVPKYFSVIEDSRQKSVQSTLQSGVVTVNNMYSKCLINGNQNETECIDTIVDEEYTTEDWDFDFTSGDEKGVVTVEITDGPGWWDSDNYNSTRDVELIDNLEL